MFYQKIFFENKSLCLINKKAKSNNEKQNSNEEIVKQQNVWNE